MPETILERSNQRIPEYSRLTPADISLILQLSEAGKTQTQIAETVGKTQPTVSRCLSEFNDTANLAKRKAHNLAYKAVQKLDEAMDEAALKGRSAPQEAILKLAGLLEQDTTRAGVTVIVGGQEATVQVHLGQITTDTIQTPMQSDAQVIDVQHVTD